MAPGVMLCTAGWCLIFLVFTQFPMGFTGKNVAFKYSLIRNHGPITTAQNAHLDNWIDSIVPLQRSKRQFVGPQSDGSLKQEGDTNVASTVNKPPTSTAAFTNDTQSGSVPQKSKSPKPIKASAIELSKPQQPQRQFLGVNGTGQRKITSFTTSSQPQTMDYNSSKRPVYSATTIIHNNETTTTNRTNTDRYNPTNNSTDMTLDVDVNEKNLNETLTKHKIFTTQTDTHDYYNSTLSVDRAVFDRYWVNLTNRTDAKINDLLINSHRRATTVQLSFHFPFYGHEIQNITVATGGFLYTGDYVHSWLAATQYVAPLMANFGTSNASDSYIVYADNGTAFTVQWNRVSLRDKPMENDFTFQATVYRNGDIVFVYRTVPTLIANIKDDNHPVKIGLSDAYIIDRSVFLLRRKTIYEYHRVDFSKEQITNWTTIYLKALPTCMSGRTCADCLSAAHTSDTSKLKCIWCPKVERCSNGFDRNRQEWIHEQCDSKSVSNVSACATVADYHYRTNSAHRTHATDPFNVHEHTMEHYEGGGDEDDDENETGNRVYNEAVRQKSSSSAAANHQRMGVSGIVTVLILIGMAGGMSLWIMYAYRNPHTTSGQILIRYRPTEWRWRRGEARYTAATIHM